MNKSTSFFIKVLVVLAGIALFTFVSWRLVTLYSIKKQGITTDAIIESYSEKRKNPQAIFGQKTKVYAPRYTFLAANGNNYTKLGEFHEEKQFTIGDKVQVVYLENNPITSALEGDLSTESSWWMFVVALVTIGAPIYYLKQS